MPFAGRLTMNVEGLYALEAQDGRCRVRISSVRKLSGGLFVLAFFSHKLF
jgi:hypothetical protein